MAWQLIYTSAPRLLEAGRSGFGTVARHRQISPLLVSAIERASQFARLPGLDADRVIYCHRIVAIAGGRFHVMSCIRDAGADYTGRTNHIAHHIVAEPREVAALGTRGASPADVLLTMPWADAWNETPRFLESEDEIALANFSPQTGAHWAQVTGDSRHAWLLVTGEASRGAYLLHTTDTDLRALFAESLRLSPDRLWQVPFTTALQPSDEPSDFRWIGLEADSTLRAQAESSGRPVLDLTRPETLPVPEVPANALTIGIPRPTALACTPPTHTPSVARAQPQQPSRKVGHLPSAPARSNRTWIIAGSAIALLLAIGFIVVRPLLVERENIRARQDALAKRLTALHIFSPQAVEPFSQVRAIHFSTADQIVTEMEKAHDALKSVRFDKMRDVKSGDALHVLAQSANIEFVPELEAFANRVRQLESLNADVSKPPASERADYEALQKQRAAIDLFAKEVQAMNVFSDAIKELRANYERAESAALLGLLHPRGSASERLPPSESALIKERIAREKPADAAAAKIFSEAEKLMADWQTVQAASTERAVEELTAQIKTAQNIWPEWLLKLARDTRAKSRGDAAAAANPAKTVTPVPLYVFNRVAAIEDARFPELEKGLTYYFRASLDAAPVELKDHTNQGNLRHLVTDPPMFGVDEKEKKFSPKPAAENLARPFILLAKNAAGHEVFQIWVVSESDKPLLPKRTAGLRRTGNSLVLDAAQLSLPGAPASRMTLLLPAECAVPGKKNEPLTVKDGAVDLSSLRAEIEKPAKDTQQRIQTLGNTLTPASDPAARFKELKAIVYDEVNKDIGNWATVERARAERKERDENKREPLFKMIEAKKLQRIEQRDRDFGKDTEPLFRQAGGCIKAFCQEATFQGHDALFSSGADLAFLDPAADTKAQMPAFSTAAAKVDAALRSLSGTNERERYEPGLKTLKAIIDLLAPETPQSKVDRARQEAQFKTKQEELRRMSAHPLLSDRVPPGVYRLSVLAEGGEIPLMDIEISR